MSELSHWAYEHGLSLEQYEELEAKIAVEARRLVAAAAKLRKTGTGVYYPVEELIPPDVRARYKEKGLYDYLLAVLISEGVEYYDSRTLYRL